MSTLIDVFTAIGFATFMALCGGLLGFAFGSLWDRFDDMPALVFGGFGALWAALSGAFSYFTADKLSAYLAGFGAACCATMLVIACILLVKFVSGK